MYILSEIQVLRIIWKKQCWYIQFNLENRSPGGMRKLIQDVKIKSVDVKNIWTMKGARNLLNCSTKPITEKVPGENSLASEMSLWYVIYKYSTNDN